MTGMSKIRGGWPIWWTADRMRTYLLGDSVQMMEFDWKVSLSLVEAPDLLFVFLGFFAVFSELAYVLVLVSRWARFLPVRRADLGISGFASSIWSPCSPSCCFHSWFR